MFNQLHNQIIIYNQINTKIQVIKFNIGSDRNPLEILSNPMIRQESGNVSTYESLVLELEMSKVVPVPPGPGRDRDQDQNFF
jgi:hypothetical protein